MQELTKRISGDWADITKSALLVRDLIEYFNLNNDDLNQYITGLKFAVESGITEYKTSLLNPLFTILAEMKFKSFSFDELKTKSRDLGALVFLILIQRLFSSGSLSFSFSKDSHAASDGHNDINEIIADVLSKIKEDPQYKNKQEVKKILTQIYIYKRERETMNKLSPNIKDKKKAQAFYSNFRMTFNKIFENIQKNYAELINKEKRESLKDIDKNILANIPLKQLVPLYTKQAREFSRIRSTLAFALDDKYKTREILVNIAKQKDAFLDLIDQEFSAFKKICQSLHVTKPEDYALKLSLSLASELASVLEKIVQKEEEQPEEES
ncbi:MAG: hypothetical protein JW822_02575 [Spirochaetales bacterium]|nr:hypothetical protein [Spirochaetales bacterium]